MFSSPLRFFISLIVFAGLILAGVWYFFFRGPEATAPTPPPPAVSVIEVKPADIPLSFEYAGRTAGSREVEIRARVSGILQERAYVEGQVVKEGKRLFTIDPAPFKAAFSEANARYIAAERDWKRIKSLYAQKAVSSREYDEGRSTYEQTKAALQTAQINLNYTTVLAPISGTTSNEGLTEGNLVTADETLLTRLTQMDPLYVYFAYPDTEALALRQKIASGVLSLPEDNQLTAEIRFGDGSVHPEQGTIDFTDSIIDTKTGTVRSRVVLSNPEGTILPGQFVRVVVKGFTMKHTIAIPDQAVMQGPQGTFVYVVNTQGKAAIQSITLGDLAGKNRLVTQGLQEGDKVIYEGMIKVRPDSPVTIDTGENAGAPADAPKNDAGAKSAVDAAPKASDDDKTAKTTKE